MYLSMCELGPDADRDPGFWQEIAAPGGAHRVLWRLFSRGPEQRRDFLFRHDTDAEGRPRFFALSEEAPPCTRSGVWRVSCRAFAPKLKPGERLQFELRASPTVKRSSEIGRRSQRHDVVMDAKRRAAAAGQAFDPRAAALIEGERWLAHQAANAGFELATECVSSIGDDGFLEERESSALRVDGYRQYRIPRGGAAPIRFSTVDYQGALIVRDCDRFLERVRRGFGSQRAFGCGLMLLRRQ